MLKIWHRDALKHTIRSHLGPVYALGSVQDFLFTGGAEGVIRKWSISALLEDRPPMSEADLHEEPIWDLAINKNKSVLLTASADQSHKMLRYGPETFQLISEISHKDGLTSVEWLTDSRFVSGFAQRNILGVFDAERRCMVW